MTAATPGQALYEAIRDAFPGDDYWPWDSLDADTQARYGQVAAREPQPAPGVTEAQLSEALDGLSVDIHDGTCLGAGIIDRPHEVARALRIRLEHTYEPQPAPGRKFGIALAALHEISGADDGDGADLAARARQALEDIKDVTEQPQSAPGDDERPETRALRELHAIADKAGWRADAQPAPELATLRELRAVVSHFADTWDELLPGLPDSYGCEMNCAEANAAADLYRALGLDATAAAIIAAHAEHDDDEERASHAEGWIGEPLDLPAPPVAPELAAAMAESRSYRAALAQVASMAEAPGAARSVSNIAKVARRALEGK